MIRTIRPLDRPDPGLERVAGANGFSLHAGASCEGNHRNKRERLCRYIARNRRGCEVYRPYGHPLTRRASRRENLRRINQPWGEILLAIHGLYFGSLFSALTDRKIGLF